jgi:steroid delta-isomerase-like uncharacterized protein
MSDRQYETLAHRWFDEVWNQGREETIDEMLAADCVAHGLGDGPDQDLIGPAAFKPFFRKFRSAFPTIQVTVEETVSEGNKIAARCTVQATHDGEGFGILPTKNKVRFSGVAIVHVRDGKISEAWNNFDFATMYHQLAAK